MMSAKTAKNVFRFMSAAFVPLTATLPVVRASCPCLPVVNFSSWTLWWDGVQVVAVTHMCFDSIGQGMHLSFFVTACVMFTQVASTNILAVRKFWGLPEEWPVKVENDVRATFLCALCVHPRVCARMFGQHTLCPVSCGMCAATAQRTCTEAFGVLV